MLFLSWLIIAIGIFNYTICIFHDIFYFFKYANKYDSGLCDIFKSDEQIHYIYTKKLFF